MTSVTFARRFSAACVVVFVTMVSLVAPSASASQQQEAQGRKSGSCKLRDCSGSYWSRAATTTNIGVASRLVRAGAAEVATIAVRARSGTQVTGTVTIALPGHGVRHVGLLNGRAAVVLPTTRSGIYSVTSTYRGDSRHLPSVQTSSYIVTGARTVTAPSLRLASASPAASVPRPPEDGSYNLELLALLGFGLASAAAVSTVLNRRRSRAN